MTPELPPRPRRCVLFVPGDRPDRFGKAIATGADAVCVDLEDGVGAEAKGVGRRAALEYLERRERGSTEIILRMNSLRTEAGLRDLLALREDAAPPDALMIPKVESAAELSWLEELLPAGFASVAFIVMVETPRGLSVVEEIADASPRTRGLFLGGVDLSVELGATRDWESLLYARSRLVQAAAAAGVAAIDMPYLEVRDRDGLDREAAAAARLGFAGKAAIHPDQVEPILGAFSPTPEQVRRAREVVDAYERAGGGVLLLEGSLVERPVVRAALRTLAAAGEGEPLQTGGE